MTVAGSAGVVALVVDLTYLSPLSEIFVYVSAPITITSAVMPRRAGTDAVILSFLFARSASMPRVVPARAMSPDWPRPRRRGLSVPSTVASMCTVLAFCMASTALLMISLGSETLGVELLPQAAVAFPPAIRC